MEDEGEGGTLLLRLSDIPINPCRCHGELRATPLLSNRGGGGRGVPLGLPQDQAAHPPTQADPPTHPPTQTPPYTPHRGGGADMY